MPGRHMLMFPKYTLLPGGHLLVHHTSAYDSYKKYTCRAENIVAVRDSGVARLSVHSE